MGMSHVLGNGVSALSEENDLVSWTVYHEENGLISLRIRYKPANGVECEDIHYKKKSAHQVQRDRECTIA
jgi:hypothetical protein